VNGLGNSSGNTVVLSGGTIELAAGANYTSEEQLVLNGDGASGQGALRKTNSGIDQVEFSLLLASDAEIEIPSGGGTLDFRGDLDINGNTLTIDGSQNFTFGFNSNILNATKTSGFGAINKIGTGTLTLRPTTDLTGNIRINAGELRQATGDFPNAGLMTLGNNVSYRSDDDPNRDVAKPVRMIGNISIGHGTGAIGEIDFLSTVDFFAFNRTLTMTNDNFISGQAINGSFTKAGTGSLTLRGSAANALSGTSIVNEGLLILHKSDGQRATDALIINTNGTVRTDGNNQWGTTTPPFVQVFGSGLLDVNETEQRLALGGTGLIDLGTMGTANLIIDNTNTGSGDTFSGVISGNGDLSKEGVGIQILTGTNTYFGTTTIIEGTLQLGSSNALPSSSPIILNGGTLRSTNATGVASLGTINLAENSTIDLGGTTEDLTFANSSSITWNSDATLTIQGWSGTAEQSGTSSQIFFNSANDLTEDQLVRIQFDGQDFGAMLIPNGSVFELVPKIQNVVRFDDFNRGPGIVVGNPSGGASGSWIEMEDPPNVCTSGPFVSINTANQLELSRGTGSSCPSVDPNLKTAAFNQSGEYATVFQNADGLLEWYFNFKYNDSSAPSGANNSAFVLGATQQNFSHSSGAAGYAVVMGDQGSGFNDDFYLIHFDNGIPNTNDFSANEILSIPQTGVNDHYSIYVSYDPCTQEWTMKVRDDGAAGFRDPTTISGTGVTTVNTDHVNLDLPYIGVFREHSTSGTRSTVFDNIYLPKQPASTNTYVWNGSVDNDYQNEDNWAPLRTCTKRNDRLEVNLTGVVEIENIPDQEWIGQFVLGPGTDLLLRDRAVTGPKFPSEVVFSGGTGDDLVVPSTATLRFDVGSSDSDDALQFILESGATADIDGTVIFQRTIGATARHLIQGTDPGSIDIEGTVIAQEVFGNWNLFGDDISPGSVVFQTGSTYESFSGGSPFGSGSTPAQTVFNEGSTYIHRGSNSFQTAGRVYANFIYDFDVNETLTAGGAVWTVDDLRILDGSLTVTGAFNSSSFPININGDLEVVSGSNFNYLVDQPSTLRFSGDQTQRLIGPPGTVTFNPNATIEVDNTHLGAGLILEQSIEVFNDFLIQNGEVQGTGVTLTLSGNNSELLVNGDIVGTGLSPGDDLSLVIDASPVTITGSNTTTCRFFGIDVLAGNTLIIDRENVESRFDQFTIGNNSILRIDAPGQAITAISDAPIYEPNSELIYNSGGTTQRGAEWSSTSGAGYPNIVTIQNGTEVQLTDAISSDFGIGGDLNIGSAGNGAGTLTMTNTANFLQVGGDVNIGDGTTAGTLNLSGVAGGDIRLEGDWNNNQNGSFNPNGRAVFFNGSTNQSINKFGASTIEIFDFLIIDNSGGDVIIGSNTTEIDVRGASNLNGFELNNGDLDLNGKIFNLGRGGDSDGMTVRNGNREIFSLTPGAIFNVDGNSNQTINSLALGTLEFDNQTTVTISSGVDFGPSVTTINATLEILAGGFANGNAPIYGPEGVLVYNTGGSYDRRVEWDGLDGQPGYPNDVIIRAGTVVLAGTVSGFDNEPLNLDRDLTIEEGASFFLDGGSVDMLLPLIIGRNLQLDGALSGSGSGGDIHLAGNWTQSSTGSYFPNDNEVLFNGTSGQQAMSATGGVTFYNAEIDNADGLLLNDNLRITSDFNFNNGIILPASAENLIFEDNATASNASNSSYYGGVVIKEGDDVFEFPVGDTNSNGANLYQPVRIIEFDNPGSTSIEAQYFAEASNNAGPWYDGSAGANGLLEEISNCEYWVVNKTNSGEPDVRLSFSYANDEPTYCNSIQDTNTVFLASFNTSDWEILGSDPVSTPGEVATLAFVDEGLGGPEGNYGEFTFTSGSQVNILPISLLSFQAEAVDGQVHTKWTTASERDNDYFTIERSKDGNHWEKAGTVDGAGDSDQELSYDFTDPRPYVGLSYYRLRQTDFNGEFTTSSPRAVEIRQNGEFALDKVYRGTDGLNLVYRSTAPYVVVEIYDLLGKRIHGELLENYGNGFGTIYPDLARGAYVLRLSHGGEMDAEKFVY
jgi:autotransporter-associated beta strand protein